LAAPDEVEEPADDDPEAEAGAGDGAADSDEEAGFAGDEDAEESVVDDVVVSAEDEVDELAFRLLLDEPFLESVA